jgi:uncharacterized protein (DUF3820 family)
MEGNEMKDESIMPFGKYKGEKLANIPPDYLLWLFDNGKCYGEVRKYIADNLDVLKSEIDYKNKQKL